MLCVGRYKRTRGLWRPQASVHSSCNLFLDASRDRSYGQHHPHALRQGTAVRHRRYLWTYIIHLQLFVAICVYQCWFIEYVSERRLRRNTYIRWTPYDGCCIWLVLSIHLSVDGVHGPMLYNNVEVIYYPALEAIKPIYVHLLNIVFVHLMHTSVMSKWLLFSIRSTCSGNALRERITMLWSCLQVHKLLRVYCLYTSTTHRTHCLTLISRTVRSMFKHGRELNILLNITSNDKPHARLLQQKLGICFCILLLDSFTQWFGSLIDTIRNKICCSFVH